MRARVRVGKFLNRFGRLVQSLAVAVMRPNDLIEFSRANYAAPQNIEGWDDEKYNNRGLTKAEKRLMTHLPIKKGRLLLLGVGGGREAIPLLRMGFKVMGVDFIPGMLQRALARTRKMGLEMDGLVQDLSNLELPAESFDVIWLSSYMYSCLPSRKKRITMLLRIAHALRPGGFFLAQFLLKPQVGHCSSRGERLRRLFARLTLGNLTYEAGDMIWDNKEFLHAFPDKKTVLEEFTAGGFTPVFTWISEAEGLGGIVAKKIEPRMARPIIPTGKR